MTYAQRDGKNPAGDMLTSHLEDDAHDPDNQPLTPKTTGTPPNPDMRLAVAES